MKDDVLLPNVAAGWDKGCGAPCVHGADCNRHRTDDNGKTFHQSCAPANRVMCEWEAGGTPE